MGSCSCTTRIQTGQAGAIRKVTGSKVLTRKTNPRSQHCIGKSSTCCSLGCSSPKTYDGEDLLSTCSSLLSSPFSKTELRVRLLCPEDVPALHIIKACPLSKPCMSFVDILIVVRAQSSLDTKKLLNSQFALITVLVALAIASACETTEVI
jgi:hypothetical protein